jgi:hypothetical protein
MAVRKTTGLGFKKIIINCGANYINCYLIILQTALVITFDEHIVYQVTGIIST